jgi:hypothetical protein
MTLALEINDAGLVLARDGHVLAEVPGCAMLDGREHESGVIDLEGERHRRSAHLHVADEVLVEVGLAVEHQPLLCELQLVQQEHQHDADQQCDEG